MGTTLNPSRLLKALAIIVFVLVEFKLYAWWTGSDASFLRFRPSEDKPFTRSRVFVASSFGAHDGQSIISSSIGVANPAAVSGSAGTAPTLGDRGWAEPGRRQPSVVDRYEAIQNLSE